MHQPSAVTDTYPQPSSYALPYSLTYTAPLNSAGTITIRALVLLSNLNYALLPPLTLLPLHPPPPLTPPTVPPINLLTQVGGGSLTFTCAFDSPTLDGGGLVTAFLASATTSGEAVTPIAQVLSNCTSTTYPVQAALTFTSPPLTLGQTYIFSIVALNAGGASPPLRLTVTNLQQSLTNVLPVTGTTAAISTGGVFGVVVGVLAFIGLLYGALRFYQRKGHFRDTALQHIDAAGGETAEGKPLPDSHAEGDEGEDAGEEGGERQEEGQEEGEDEEELEEELELGEQDLEDEVDADVDERAVGARLVPTHSH